MARSWPLARGVTVLVVVLGGVATLVSGLSFWLRDQVFDAESFAATGEETLLEQESLDAVANLAIDELLAEFPVMRERIREPAVAAIGGVLGSDLLAPVRARAVELAHAAITTDDPTTVTIGIDGFGEMVVGLATVFDPELASRLSGTLGEITLYEGGEVPSVADLAGAIDWLGPVVAALAIGLLALAVLGSEDRWRALTWAGFAVVIAAFATFAVAVWGRGAVLRGIDAETGRIIADTAWTVLTGPLIVQTVVVLAFGAAVAVWGRMAPART